MVPLHKHVYFEKSISGVNLYKLGLIVLIDVSLLGIKKHVEIILHGRPLIFE